MAYKIIYKSSVARDLKIIDKQQVQRILDKIEESLSENPHKYPMLHGWFKGQRKLVVSNYRVIYKILENIEETVIVAKISHRKDAYKLQ
ncbi:MAG: type II toxin-antitoxin system RelE/ParE family toxin [Candidatus Dadabacteria bacterium]|nr:type II toxin-antitoxin system RelE/ParE family toxin [Candidatus Dadabacteria bacterium]